MTLDADTQTDMTGYRVAFQYLDATKNYPSNSDWLNSVDYAWLQVFREESWAEGKLQSLTGPHINGYDVIFFNVPKMFYDVILKK